MAYPDTDDIKAYIGSAKTTDDALLTTLAASAQAYIEGPSGADRRFAVTADTTRRFDALRDTSSDRRTLHLDDDLCQVTSITNGDGATVSASDYVFEPRNHPPYRAIRLMLTTTAPIWQWVTAPENAITIVGRWGYSTTPPDDIAHAYIALVAYLYRRRGASSEMDRPLIGEGGVLIVPSQIPKDIQGILAGYRRRWLA